MTSYLCGYLGRKVGRHGMSSSSHEGFITSLSHIVRNNRRSRKYGYLVARQLSRSDNVRLYADPRVYGPSCTLQFLHLILSLFAISRGNAADTRARGMRMRKKLLQRNFYLARLDARHPIIEDIVQIVFLNFLKFRTCILI